MIVKRFAQAASATAFLAALMAGNASAASITYNTNAAATEFVSTGNDTLVSSNNANSTLVFTPNASSTTGLPSGLDLGDFELTCGGCSTTATTSFAPFVFNILVTDITDGATGIFVGTSTGGTVSSNSDTIVVTWTTTAAGLTLGPGTLNAITGNFGSTVFDKIVNTTVLAAPNSGSPQGDTTVQGQIVASPEPATFALIGGGMIALGIFGRRKFLRS